MPSLLNIGITGLRTHQTALSTVGNNISNASVEGYSRQEAIFSSRASQNIGGGFVGGGANISTVRRIHDAFKAQNVVNDTQRFEALQVLSQGLSALDNVLASEGTGLSGVLDDLFSSVQLASESPASLSLRQQVLSEADRFVSRYRDISTVLENTLAQINENVTTLASEATQIAEGIAVLNQSISESRLQNGSAPNDLLDSRDQLLRDLATKIDYTSAVQDGDFVNVYLSSGQALVLGTDANSLMVIRGEQSGDQVELAIAEAGGGVQTVTDAIRGGQLGGELRLREEGIGDIESQLGLMATLAVSAFNTVHTQGIDLNQQPGRDFFTPIDSRQNELGRVQYVPGNSSPNAIASVHIDDVSQLEASEYSLVFDGASVISYELTRLSDGAVVHVGTFSGSAPHSISTSDGFTINLEQGSFTSGDQLLINPARLPAENLEVLVSSPASLAFGLPISLEASVDNTGTGTIQQPGSAEISALLQAESSGGVTLTTEPLLIRFTSPTTYDILDNTDPDNPVNFVPPQTNLSFVPGQNNTLLAANDSSTGLTVGFDIVVGGVPEVGDEFVVNFDYNGSGDNRNALALAQLQNADILGNGVGSIGDIYASLVGAVGVATASANIDTEAANSLLARSTSELQSESGVNLDEEAAKLLQYEQAYNASAQVISVARTLFDSLLAAFR